MSIEKIECLSWAKEEWETPEKTIAGLKSLIEAVQDFPIKGVLFRDIMPIFRVPLAVSSMIDMIAAYIEVHYADVDAIVGLDARGFLFGPMIALSLEKPFLPIRKKGKLPGKCISIESSKEYGSDILEMQCSGISEGYNVIIVDDLLATGDINNILYNKQFGFIKGQSTDQATVHLVNDILNSFGENKYALAVFIGLSMAFNTVNHYTLLT
ncbi:uncharacterized protein LOC136091737 [Hydra vulgaris]|uniref:adenine phosphoribosyltransferase n=1 Tax=Hydra vulgaris TaxID=6087 RepID=A0ABM4DLV0_HYDVU